MRISQAHLDQLVCPVCHGPLRLLPTGNAIDCRSCQRCYPIEDDLPILLAGRATMPPS